MPKKKTESTKPVSEEESAYTMTEATVPEPSSREEKQDAAREVKREAREVAEARTEAEKPLEEKLYEIYDAAPSGQHWYPRTLTVLTGASQRDVNVAWHSLWATNKVASPEFLKP